MSVKHGSSCLWAAVTWLLACVPVAGQTSHAVSSQGFSRTVAHAGQEGEGSCTGAYHSVDAGILCRIYDLGSPFSEAMVVADRSAWPLFVGGPPVAWVFAAVSGDRGDSRFALSVSLAEGSAVVSALVLKRVFRRPRPYVEMASIVPRSRAHRAGRAGDPHSFPSGHAAMSFSIATAVALESGRWYVVVPSLTWAASVSLSRVWLGVHYPSDVLAGAILGGGAALVSHFIAAELIGSEDDSSGAGMAFSIVRVTL